MSFQEKYPRPYYAKYEPVDIGNDFGWFQVYRLPGDVFAITEQRHCEEVTSFLIPGDEKALLWDTGEGFYDITAVARELYNGAIIAANSHSHFDHIGCNHRFDCVLAYDDPQAFYTAERGAPHALFGNLLEADMFAGDLPEGLDPETFSVPPYRICPVREGDEIDLGGRILEVIHTPGHSSDSMMLFDRTHGILFTGDTIYDAAMYAHFNCPEFGYSNVDDYIASMEKLISRKGDIRALYCSHNDLIVPPSRIQDVADALKAVKSGTVLQHLGVEPEQQYLEDGSVLTKCVFEDFSIVCRI